MKMYDVEFKGGKKSIIINDKNIAVNVNLGLTNFSYLNLNKEIKKLEKLFYLPFPPDMVMDLSLTNKNGYLYDYIAKNIGCPIGIIPHYFTIDDNGNIDKVKLIDEMIRAAENGVSWFVLNFSLTKETVSFALSDRVYPFSSRSAIILLKDMIINNRKRSIYWEIINDIIYIAQKYKVVLSLGAAFRPAVISDTLDRVHMSEIKEYKALIDFFIFKGIKVITEGIGHCDINKIDDLINILNQNKVPVMPLGPLFENVYNNDEDIANIFGFYYAITKGANFRILNTITSEEHSGGIPSENSIIKAYLLARRCAEFCNNLLNYSNKDYKNICLENNKSIGCDRCENFCPIAFSNNNIESIQKWIKN